MKNKLLDSTFFLTALYTIGHFFIAMICNALITGADLDLAALDALIEPLINGVWFYILHKGYKNYKQSREAITN